MGRLGDQPERSAYRVTSVDLSGFISDAANIAREYDTTLETVISAKHALEIERQNDIAIQSGNFLDEQAGGFGEILSRIADALGRGK